MLPPMAQIINAQQQGGPQNPILAAIQMFLSGGSDPTAGLEQLRPPPGPNISGGAPSASAAGGGGMGDLAQALANIKSKAAGVQDPASPAAIAKTHADSRPPGAGGAVPYDPPTHADTRPPGAGGGTAPETGAVSSLPGSGGSGAAIDGIGIGHPGWDRVDLMDPNARIEQAEGVFGGQVAPPKYDPDAMRTDGPMTPIYPLRETFPDDPLRDQLEDAAMPSNFTNHRVGAGHDVIPGSGVRQSIDASRFSKPPQPWSPGGTIGGVKPLGGIQMLQQPLMPPPRMPGLPGSMK